MHGAESMEIWGKNIHRQSVTEAVAQSRRKSHSLGLSTRFSYTHLDFLHVPFAPNRQTKLLQHKAYTYSSREWIRKIWEAPSNPDYPFSETKHKCQTLDEVVRRLAFYLRIFPIKSLTV
jgi:hypothetical protein